MFYKALIDQMQDGVFLVQGNRIAFVNGALCRMLGYTERELLGREVGEVLAPEDRDWMMERHAARLRGEDVPSHYQFDALRKDGSRCTMMMSIGFLKLDDGGVGAVGSVKDLSRELEISRRLQEKELELRRILDNLPDVFYRTDESGRLTMVSPACKDLVGYEQEEVLGRNLADLYAEPEARQTTLQEFHRRRGQSVHVETALRHKEGHVVWVSTNAYARYDRDGRFIGVEGITRDITPRKQLENQLRYLADHDYLTGLLNRKGFTEQLVRAVAACRRESEQLSLVYIDLDGFKGVNDRLGHRAGDRVLVDVAGALRDSFREADAVARIGGDEFAVLLQGSPDARQLNNLVERFSATLAQTLDPSGEPTRLSASVGAARYPSDGVTADELLLCADANMYSRKRRSAVVGTRQS